MAITLNDIDQMVSDYKAALEHKTAGETLVRDHTIEPSSYNRVSYK